MTDSASQAFWLSAPGNGEIRPASLPAPSAGQVRIRALYSGVSRGTETLVFRGEVPEREYTRMRAPFQEGDFPAPLKYGYSSVGVVEEGPETLLGRHVFCLYPHQTRYVVEADAVHPLPDAVPPGRAVLAANMETAVNALWDAPVRPGDRVAVVGAGTLGCLVARLAAKVPGARVQLVDINPRRAEVAEALGANFATPEVATDGCDLVVHSSASPEGLSSALHMAGFEATVLELSWYGRRRIALPLGEDFHGGRLTLRASQVGTVAAARRARWSRSRRLALALELLDDPALDILITGEDRFDDLPALMKRLAGGQLDALCHRIRYD